MGGSIGGLIPEIITHPVSERLEIGTVQRQAQLLPMQQSRSGGKPPGLAQRRLGQLGVIQQLRHANLAKPTLEGLGMVGRHLLIDGQAATQPALPTGEPSQPEPRLKSFRGELEGAKIIPARQGWLVQRGVTVRCLDERVVVRWLRFGDRAYQFHRPIQSARPREIPCAECRLRLGQTDVIGRTRCVGLDLIQRVHPTRDSGQD